VSGNDVYVAGTEGNAACYWKNGEKVELSRVANSSTKDIAVSESDIYVAGTEGNAACYWKNGKKIALSGGSRFGPHPKAIAVSGNDVYVVSYSYQDQKTFEYKPGCYWKNGVMITLLDAGNYDSVAAIAVVERDYEPYARAIHERGRH
jgi:hypothetical protein